jgi:hypothetical protein
MSAIVCPDCTGTEVEQHLKHDQTCPLGLDIDAITDADRRFFEEHPGTTKFYRPVMASEITEQRMFGQLPDVPGQAVGKVLVTSIGPGVRARCFDDVVYVIDTDAGAR